MVNIVYDSVRDELRKAREQRIVRLAEDRIAREQRNERAKEVRKENIVKAMEYLEFVMEQRGFSASEVENTLLIVRDKCQKVSHRESIVLWHIPHGILVDALKKQGIPIERLGFIHIVIPKDMDIEMEATREYGVRPRALSKDSIFVQWQSRNN